MEGFSKPSGPLIALKRKNAKLVWAEKCEGSFLELKRLLTMAPMLVLPKPSKPLVLFNDAYKYGLGCILIQEGWVVAYASSQ